MAPALEAGTERAPISFAVRRASAVRRFFASRAWRVLRVVLSIGLGAVALDALNGQRDELVGASSELAHLRVGWLLVAIAAELVSLAEFGQLQRRLLAAGGVDLPAAEAVGLSVASGAIASSLPAGPAFASVYAFRIYRRFGADETLAAWVLLATLVCAALTLSFLAAAGVGLALQESLSYDLVGVILALFAISVLADAIVLQRQWLARVVAHAFGLSRRLVGRPRRHGSEVVEAVVARLSRVHLTRAGLVRTLWPSLASWLGDCGALAASFLAVGHGVPWRALLLTYGAAQLAANLPITPGGLGVVEGTITIALVAFGGQERSIIAAVICYRIVSFWGYLPIGWLVWLAQALRHRRADRIEAEAVTMSERVDVREEAR